MVANLILVTCLLHFLVFSLIFLWYLAGREMQPGLQRSGCSSFLVKSPDTYESCNMFLFIYFMSIHSGIIIYVRGD